MNTRPRRLGKTESPSCCRTVSFLAGRGSRFPEARLGATRGSARVAWESGTWIHRHGSIQDTSLAIAVAQTAYISCSYRRLLTFCSCCSTRAAALERVSAQTERVCPHLHCEPTVQLGVRTVRYLQGTTSEGDQLLIVRVAPRWANGALASWLAHCGCLLVLCGERQPPRPYCMYLYR
ncbi:hypothetical protein VTK73DRAFT_4770 [Phialemonium thermophilum]|uniref:Uncharacterized protein n=1 Tax=Phialemonium thermophilum TaxID=223376 RepID=A0ABR3V605_9PEZI